MKARPIRATRFPANFKRVETLAVEITLGDLEVVKLTPEDIPGAFIENKSKVLAEMYTTGFS